MTKVDNRSFYFLDFVGFFWIFFISFQFPVFLHLEIYVVGNGREGVEGLEQKRGLNACVGSRCGGGGRRGRGKQVGRCKKLVGRIRFLNSLWQQKSADSCAENGTGIVPRQ